MANDLSIFLNTNLEKLSRKLPKDKMDLFLVKFMLLLFLIGLFIPSSWRQLLGVIGYPISWTAATIPSIRKVSAVSPISELVQGFFGIGFLLVPPAYIVLLKVTASGQHFKCPRNGFIKILKFVVLLYLLAIPAFIGILYYIVFLPGTLHFEKLTS